MNLLSTNSLLQHHANFPADELADWTTQLDDGSIVTIRPIRRDDDKREREFIENLSTQSRYYRFLYGMAHPSSSLIKKLVDIDHRRDEAYVALVEQKGEIVLAGASRYYSESDNKSCECAVVVADAWQHKGLGTLLMQRLINTAKARNIQRMYSVDSVENSNMRDFSARLGFQREVNPKDPTLIVHTLILR